MLTGEAGDRRRRASAAAAALLLTVGLGACATVAGPPRALDPKPLAVETLGPSDGQYGRDAAEARRLAGVKGAWRRGDLLTVDTDEGVQYRFVDAGMCEGFDTCRRWTFQGSAQVPGRRLDGTAHTVGYWLIEMQHGEGGYWLAIGKESSASITLDTGPVASRDGRRWASGECNEESSDSLTIYEATDTGQMIAAAAAGDMDACCDIVGWDGEALKVKLCDLEPAKAYADRLVRQPNGDWVGQHVRLKAAKAP